MFERDMRFAGDKEALLVARRERRVLSLNTLLGIDKEKKREDDNFVKKNRVQYIVYILLHKMAI